MGELPTPTAGRLRPPSWRDSRLLVGVLLVLVSVVLGVVLVARADDRVPMYAASAQLVPGRPLTDADVVRVDVQLGDAAAGYLSADGAVPEGSFVLREVRAGELVPVVAVGNRDQVGAQPVALDVAATSAAALRVGSVVDVYVNRPEAPTGSGTGLPTFAGPERTLEGVSVVSVAEDTGVLGSGGTATRAVQVMVPTGQVQQLVGDVDLGAKITLVPVPGALAGSGS